MTNEHPITPPPELVASLRNSAPHGIRDAGVTREIWLINHAYAAGAEKEQALADQELEACCEWVRTRHHIDLDGHDQLRAARRPKPPTLKEQALEALEEMNEPLGVVTVSRVSIIRRALEALDD
jgi:hypothetical protein